MVMQMNIFECLDDTLGDFQKQVDLPLIDCKVNHTFTEQNRQLWILSYLDENGDQRRVEVTTMIDDHRIIFAPCLKLRLTTWKGEYKNGQCLRDIWYEGVLFCREIASNQYKATCEEESNAD